MANAYIDLTTLKGTGFLNITGTGDNARLRALIESVSRNIEDYCGRHFFSQIRTLYFTGNGKARMPLLADLVSITTLTEDTDGNDTYDKTWASTDYVLFPYEASPTAKIDIAQPYTHIEVDERSTGTQYSFGKGQKRFKLVGIFGWSQSTLAAASLTAEVLDATETGVDVDAGTDFAIGQTILIDSEQMYITGIATNTLTVERGVNGTTAATHVTASAIAIIQYPSPVREACLIETARMWRLKDSGFASSIGIPETGVIQAFGGALHPRARNLLDTYRKLAL